MPVSFFPRSNSSLGTILPLEQFAAKLFPDLRVYRSLASNGNLLASNGNLTRERDSLAATSGVWMLRETVIVDHGVEHVDAVAPERRRPDCGKVYARLQTSVVRRVYKRVLAHEALQALDVFRIAGGDNRAVDIREPLRNERGLDDLWVTGANHGANVCLAIHGSNFAPGFGCRKGRQRKGEFLHSSGRRRRPTLSKAHCGTTLMRAAPCSSPCQT